MDLHALPLLHRGVLGGATHEARVGNPACGDILTLQARVTGNRVEAAHFETLGSPYQAAAAELVCRQVEGEEVVMVDRLRVDQVAGHGLLEPANRFMVQLAIDGVRRCLTRPRVADVANVDVDADVVKALLSAAGRSTTSELSRRAAVAGIPPPPSWMRTLLALRASGEVAGELDEVLRVHVWWTP